MEPYRAMLVPLDGSPLSEQSLPLALGIARRLAIPIYLARVVEAESGLGDAVAERVHHGRACAERDLETLAARLRDEVRLPIATALLDEHDQAGHGVAATLYAFAHAIGIGLIVMSTHGRGGLTRLWLGSVADALLHLATLPLLLVRPDSAAPAQAERLLDTILVPLDGGALAEHAIEHALALGTPGRTTYILQQIISPLLAEHTVPPFSSGPTRAEAEALAAEARAYLLRAARLFGAQQGQVRTQVCVADPADAILAAAREQHADLIAMATHGRGVLARTVLGSVADRVVRNADVPVLVYRPAAQWPEPARPAGSVALAL